ncbi:hypothetical protein EON63_05330 [archaeon]|nr:MAG: hypothetical protein EON63_05330 [archaeon]
MLYAYPYSYTNLPVALSTLITPPSIISWYKSLPSLVRSPTPAKTEYPPWFMAMLLISSCVWGWCMVLVRIVYDVWCVEFVA